MHDCHIRNKFAALDSIQFNYMHYKMWDYITYPFPNVSLRLAMGK